MLMAARNGQGLSDNDMEGMLEDLAKLERLDGEDDEDGEKVKGGDEEADVPDVEEEEDEKMKNEIGRAHV